MIANESLAVVTALQGGNAVLELDDAASSCGSCGSSGSCGKGNGAKRVFVVPNGIGVRPGDHVVLSVAPGGVLKAALWAYFVPVLLALCGAAIGAGLEDGGVFAPLGAVLGLACGIVLFRSHERRSLRAGEPLMSMTLQQRAIHFYKEARE